ncbi:MAG: hypothetical protein AAFV32_06650 [Myxococcota bacterium]
MQHYRSSKILRFYLLSALLAVCACGDDDSSGADDRVQFADPASDQLFLVGYSTRDVDGNATAFANAVPSLDQNQGVDQTRALELNGFSVFATNPFESDTFFVGRGTGAVVERYQVDADGFLELTGEIVFAGSTASRTQSPWVFESSTRAYFLDAEGLNVIVWNPSAMEIDQVIDLDVLNPPEGTRAVPFQLIRDQDRLLVSSGYFRNDQETHAPIGRLAIVDIDTFEVTVAEQTRCGYLLGSVLAPDGFHYFASHPNQSTLTAIEAAGDPPSPHCLVRFESGGSAWDESFFVDLNALVGRPLASVVPRGGSLVYATVSPEGPSAFDAENRLDRRRAPVWEIYTFDLTDPAGTIAPANNTLTTSDQIGAFVAEVNDANGNRIETPFIPLGGATDSTFFDVSDPDSWIQQITVPGTARSIGRLR